MIIREGKTQERHWRNGDATAQTSALLTERA